jgi:phosphoglycolate phosphatase-like HAD superfamily hydrolase
VRRVGGLGYNPGMMRALPLLLLAACAGGAPGAGGDPLPSWNDGPRKQAILDFAKAAVATYSPEERVAVFDNDGTLWSEKPVYFQLEFIEDRVKALAPQHPDWKEREPFKSILEGDLAKAMAGGAKALEELSVATQGGMSGEEFEKIVLDWTSRARHPRTERFYTEMVFQPMLELLNYLRACGFKTYLVSGGGVDFLRPWTQRVYGIPPEQVIGSVSRVKYELKDGVPTIARTGEVEFIDDGAGKPAAIYRAIGRRPIAAFGNSDGDREMLEWTTAGPGRRLGLIVHHTDAAREWAYDRTSVIGKLDKALDEAPKKGWLLVDMKKDWRIVYPFQK